MSRSRVAAYGATAVGLLAIIAFAATRSAAERRPLSSVRAEATGEVIPGPSAESTNGLAPAVVEAPEPSPPTPVSDPAMAEMVDELARFDDELSQRLEVPSDWRPPRRAIPAKRPTLPPLPTNREPASQLAEASKWFEALPNAKPKSEAELTARRERMDKAGLELLRSECRSGVCRLSFVYSKNSSERLKNRMNGHDSARGRPNWMSFTILRSDGRVEGHIFMVSGPGHGGGR